MKSAARPPGSLQMFLRAQSRFQVSCSNASPLPGANEVGGHDRGKHYLLPTYYSSSLQYLALYPGAVVSYAIRTKLKLRKGAGLLALTCSSSSVAAS